MAEAIESDVSKNPTNCVLESPKNRQPEQTERCLRVGQKHNKSSSVGFDSVSEEHGMSDKNSSEGQGCLDIAKDGKQAWIVAIAGSVNFFLAVGLYRTLGIILVELMEVFDADTTEASLLFSAYGGSYSISALILSTMLGGIFHDWIMIVFGTLVGSLGFLVVFFSSRIEYVTFGLGICMEFAIRGTSLILAGIALNSLVCSCFMKPTYLHRKVHARKQTPDTMTSTQRQDLSPCENGHSLRNPRQNTEQTVSKGGGDVGRVEPKCNSKLTKRRQMFSSNCHNPPKHARENPAFDNTDEPATTEHVNGHIEGKQHIHSQGANDNSGADNKFPLRSYIFMHKENHKGLSLKDLFDLSVFKEPKRFILILMFFICNTAVELVAQFYPAISRGQGMTPYQSALLLSVSGAAGLVGRIMAGFLGNYLKDYCLLLLIAQVIVMLAIFVCQYAVTFWSQVIFAMTFGMTYGIPFVYKVPIIRDFFSHNDVTKVIGMDCLLRGIGLVVANPFIGWLRDMTGGYIVPLYAAITMYAVSCSLILLIIWLRRHAPKTMTSYEDEVVIESTRL